MNACRCSEQPGCDGFQFDGGACHFLSCCNDVVTCITVEGGNLYQKSQCEWCKISSVSTECFCLTLMLTFVLPDKEYEQLYQKIAIQTW